MKPKKSPLPASTAARHAQEQYGDCEAQRQQALEEASPQGAEEGWAQKVPERLHWLQEQKGKLEETSKARQQDADNKKKWEEDLQKRRQALDEQETNLQKREADYREASARLKARQGALQQQKAQLLFPTAEQASGAKEQALKEQRVIVAGQERGKGNWTGKRPPQKNGPTMPKTSCPRNSRAFLAKTYRRTGLKSCKKPGTSRKPGAFPYKNSGKRPKTTGRKKRSCSLPRRSGTRSYKRPSGKRPNGRKKRLL